MLSVRQGMWKSGYTYVKIEKDNVSIDLDCLNQVELKELISELKSDIENLESCVLEE